MSCTPKNPNKFFKKLGAKCVERMLIDGELESQLADTAKIWLDARRTQALHFWAVAAAILALVGIVVAVGVPVYQAQAEFNRITVSSKTGNQLRQFTSSPSSPRRTS